MFWAGPTPLTAIVLGMGMVVTGVGAVGMSAGARTPFRGVLIAGVGVMAVGLLFALWHPRWALPPAMRDRGRAE